MMPEQSISLLSNRDFWVIPMSPLQNQVSSHPISASGVMAKRFATFLILALLVCDIPTAEAGCSDRPSAGVDWSGCIRINRIMTGYNFRNAKLSKVNFGGSDLAGADLSGADLTSAVLIRARLTGAVLNGANLSKATLDRADISGTDLSSAQFVKARLARANLTSTRLGGANLEKADLQRAVLMNADLSGTILRGASFARADLRGAHFANADLHNAQFNLADLRGADLSRSTGLVQAQLGDTCGDDRTRLPPGISPPANWECARIQGTQ